MSEKIGFIGLGLMGRPMALNLIKAGYELSVRDRTAAVEEELAKAGAKVLGSAKEIAAASDIVITMLPDSPDVDLVVAGEGGVLEGIRSGALLIDMSSISPVVTRRPFFVVKKLKFQSNDTRIVGAYFSDTANHAHWPSLSEIPSIGKELAKKKGQTEKKLVKAKSAAGLSEKG
jgi:3-hydroxyisobutyrate dehydrogenase-like beta-hydroxyacid dehydrogenase